MDAIYDAWMARQQHSSCNHPHLHARRGPRCPVMLDAMAVAAATADGGDRKRSGRLWITDAIVQFPCLSLMIFLVPPLWMATLGMIHGVELMGKGQAFDVSVDAFQVRRSHFSQRRNAALDTVIEQENAQPGVRRTHRRRAQTWEAPRTGDVSGVRNYIIDRVEIILFWEDHRNMLTEEGLRRVQQVERAIQSAPGYSDWCVMDPALFGAGVCAPATSVTTYFFPSALPGSNQLSYDGRGDSIVDFQGTLVALGSQTEAHWFMSESYKDDSSTLLRSEFAFATPQPATAADRAAYADWMRTLVPILEAQSTVDGPAAFRCVSGGSEMTPYLIVRALFKDLRYAIASALLVLFYTAWHTRSLLLAICSLSMVFLSFPVSLFFYYHFFTVDGSEALGILNILGVYIILGIGVDDVYVKKLHWNTKFLMFSCTYFSCTYFSPIAH
jgi:hypothetical protein